MAQAQVPLFFDGRELRVCSALNYVAASALDPLVALTDGSKAFTAPVAGVDPVDPQDLTTKAWVQRIYGVVPTWLPPVLGVGPTTPPPLPEDGDRWIVPVGATGSWLGQDNQIATWEATLWTFSPAPEGGTTVSIGDGIQRFYLGGAWQTAGQATDHNTLQNLQGGITAERFHLTAAQHTVLDGSKPSRHAVMAPDGGGPLAVRAIEAADIQLGLLAPARGGLGVDASAATGFSRWNTGVLQFVPQINWSDIAPGTIPAGFTPSAHAASHQPGGTDQLVLDMSQITTGSLPLARGGTGADLQIVPQRTFWAGPTGSQGAPTFRAIGVNDITGATGALQVIRRDALNQANGWATLDALAFGAVPVSTQVVAGAFMTGGGPLSSNVILNWQGLAVLFGGTEVGRWRQLEFVGDGVSVASNPTNQKTVVTITQGGGGGGGAVDASASYARAFLFGGS